ncbi:hypothetical protein EJ06DRAFT_508746 [Trichodelitschia bisporula]|uniref:Uncharacterized protein n=1 Tax=Trichodelitschia bisporula TaxID=703511 RepID=A0A6G1HYZ9_9PEZI|nr:hypothetical protein EJ06DRAFT_508746 [Trichodelitschia bisporula]
MRIAACIHLLPNRSHSLSLHTLNPRSAIHILYSLPLRRSSVGLHRLSTAIMPPKQSKQATLKYVRPSQQTLRKFFSKSDDTPPIKPSGKQQTKLAFSTKSSQKKDEGSKIRT